MELLLVLKSLCPWSAYDVSICFVSDCLRHVGSKIPSYMSLPTLIRVRTLPSILKQPEGPDCTSNLEWEDAETYFVQDDTPVNTFDGCFTDNLRFCERILLLCPAQQFCGRAHPMHPAFLSPWSTPGNYFRFSPCGQIYHNDSDCSDACRCLPNGTLSCSRLQPCTPSTACRQDQMVFGECRWILWNLRGGFKQSFSVMFN